MNDRNLLFYGNHILDVVRHQTEKAKQAVDAIAADRFLASTDDQLVEHVCAEHQITPLELYEDRMQMTQHESKLDMTGDFRYGGFRDERVMVPSLRVTVTIPYTGDEALWGITPNPHILNHPRAVVNRPDHKGIGQIIITIERPSQTNPEEYKQSLEQQLNLIREFLKNQKVNVADFNRSLPAEVRRSVEARRKRLDHHSAITKALNIPMIGRPGAPDVQPISVPKKIVRPLPPAAPAKAEYGIRDEDYEHILKIIRHEGCSFETTPETFAKHDEEELRDIILAHLNGHYQGDAAGEKFRRKGKTDISIEAENRAAFVAECKVWRGAKECAEAADQLLSYLTWRDCKCALIFFNTKVAGFTGAQEALAAALRKHPRFVSEVGGAPAGEWRFRLNHATDDTRVVTVHVFFFDLFVKSKKAGGGA